MSGPIQRDAVCEKCGADLWYVHGQRGPVCAPCHRERIRRQRHTDYTDPATRMVYRARERASEQGLPCTITAEDIRAIMPARCPALGEPWGPGERRPSLDRLVPSKGYVPGNVAVISMRANIIKNNATTREVLLVGRWMRRQGLK